MDPISSQCQSQRCKRPNEMSLVSEMCGNHFNELPSSQVRSSGFCLAAFSSLNEASASSQSIWFGCRGEHLAPDASKELAAANIEAAVKGVHVLWR